MPFYDLKCSQCGKEFNQKATITMRENREIPCPDCGGFDLEPVFKSVQYVIKKKESDGPACPNAHRCGGGCCH